uniref:Cryptochrome/DNA photolyase FAD-binding domain-containing protein n=1 Tax=Grammatophora oceanica TaxID=210454 RepID=A0A7S1URL2_9STRA
MNSKALVWHNPLTKPTEWTRWATGQTGFPLVDAALCELMKTGYCSNRVRQNAASFLTKDLELDWRAGAEWFQFLLEDFCVGANWGNWTYFSGVGSDPKQRHFRTVSQAKRYDVQGLYVSKWLPALVERENHSVDGNTATPLIVEARLRPWDFLGDDTSGQIWPPPLVDPRSQYTWQDLNQLDEKGTLFAEDDDDK